MDGNGRWATRRLMNRVKGHEQGAAVVRNMVRACSDLKIRVLTLYAFSTENWQRSSLEVSALMRILKSFLRDNLPEMMANNIQFSVIGQIERLPADVQEAIAHTRSETAAHTGTTLNLALSYGGRSELTHAAQTLARRVADGSLAPEDITEDLFAGCLYTRDLPVPDPDLVIRTSGERRVSNFLLWQAAYAEFFFTPTLWPDFTVTEFIDILKDFQGRERRFGKVPA